MNKSDCTILIPVLNEQSTILATIEDWKSYGFTEILVVDGHSTDDTVNIAKSAGATVIEQLNKGKGDAVVYGIHNIKTKYCIMVDGDNTYPAYYSDVILSLLEKGNDHVIGNRLLEYDKGAFKALNLIGNIGFTLLFKLKYGKNVQDLLSGYRAFRTETMMDLKCTGFEVETEMCKLIVRKNLKLAVIPTRYKARIDNNQTKLHPFKDGWKILTAIIRN